MARFTFGGDISQFIGAMFSASTPSGTEERAVKAALSATAFQFYTTATGGVVTTDYLLDPDNDGVFDSAAASITVREDGYLPDFQGPDAISRLYYDPDPADATVARVHLDAWDKTVGGAAPASETVAGIAELATTAEATAGTDTARITTPAGVAAAINAHAALADPHPQYLLEDALGSALSAKADLVTGMVPLTQLPVGTGPTANTIMQRRSGGTAAVAPGVASDEVVTVGQMVPTLVATWGNDTAAINTFLAAASPSAAKRLIGAFSVTGTITLPAGVHLDLTAATITQTSATATTVSVGAGASIRGGRINCPSTWDGANVAWTYAVVLVTGNDVTVEGLTISNVPKVGIGFRDVDRGIVTGCRILGNYPSGQWTGVETAHFGIAIDPSGSSEDGNFTISGGNIVTGCVQGLSIGNFGAGAGSGISVTGNVFFGCWNHGVYGSSGSGVSVVGNSFNRCQYPIAMTGAYHTVTGNTLYTAFAASDQRDFTGISMRNPVGCVVSENTIKGQVPSGQVVINLTDLGGGTVVRDNVVAHNIIEVTGAGTTAIKVNSGGTTCENNLVQGNRIRCGGIANQGAISVVGVSGSNGKSNQVLDNVVIVTSPVHGIFATFQSGLRVRGNVVRWECDAGSSMTLGGVALNTVSDSHVSENEFVVEAAWGLNIALRGVWEFTAGGLNRSERNRYRFDLTKLTSGTPLVLLTGGTVIDEAGTGVPGMNAGVGSVWRRTDGGAATSFYIKESGNGATGWVGK